MIATATHPHASTDSAETATAFKQAFLHTVSTDDGPFSLLAIDDGCSAGGAVISAGWTDSQEELRVRLRPQNRHALIVKAESDAVPGSAAAEAVLRYYAGDIAAIDDVRIQQWGTPFLLNAWQQLRQISAGAPLSYTEFAGTLDRPKAVRAAASACATNAVALFVPCHRVLRSDGSLGGFGWGLDIKESLLARESRP